MLTGQLKNGNSGEEGVGGGRVEGKGACLQDEMTTG